MIQTFLLLYVAMQLIWCYLIQVWVDKHRYRVHNWMGKVAEVRYNNGKSVYGKKDYDILCFN